MAIAARAIKSEEAQLMIARGVESMSRTPFVSLCGGKSSLSGVYQKAKPQTGKKLETADTAKG